MKIVNAEVKIPIIKGIESNYFENWLKQNNYDFIRWAIVDVEKTFYVLNVSYKIED